MPKLRKVSAKKVIGILCNKMGFDNGYFSGANLRYLERNRLDGYIPDSKQAGT